MIFLLVMEVLSGMIQKVDVWSLFKHLGVHSIVHWVPFYVDNLILSNFMKFLMFKPNLNLKLIKSTGNYKRILFLWVASTGLGLAGY
jgi:hypothetical protein